MTYAPDSAMGPVARAGERHTDRIGAPSLSFEFAPPRTPEMEARAVADNRGMTGIAGHALLIRARAMPGIGTPKPGMI